jgi:LysM repeat protein
MMTCGMPLPESKEYRELLQSRLGVKLQGVSGCMVSSEEMIYLSAYNEVAKPFLESRYGKNFLEALSQEAKELHEKRAERFKNASTYIVKRGDTLTKIARANRTTVNALQEFNDSAADGLQAGQQLKLP